MSSDPCNWVHGLWVNADVVCWQLTLCDPHLSALEVKFSRRCAIQIDVYLFTFTTKTKTDTNPIPDPNRYRRRCPDPNARIQKI